jgi:UDP-N-acetylglucosamine--N-acetylmuramyl-(pentapeptide) pyrophosphoryl-undecaprenol N-acetylglucosamine transferase
MKQLKVIVSGGGTGGHIFPAIAIVKLLEKKVSNIDVLFVGAKEKMEMIKIPSEGYNIEGLWISGLQRRITTDNLSFPFKLVSSLLKARKIIKRFKPDIAIGTGGYASGPLLYMAAKLKVPTIIQEQNSYPGITNKILSRTVDKVCVAYDNMERFFPKEKIVFTGNPIREDILELETKYQQGISHFKLNENKKTVLVIGGSLGSRTINQSIGKNIEFFKKNNLNLIWQTGISYQEKATEIISSISEKEINSYTFIKKMDLAYATADIIISRAGAIAISELCSVGKPAILIPSPNVSEDHQTKNAQAVVNKMAALLVKDKEVDSKLVICLKEIIDNEKKQKQLSENIKKLAVINAANIIANEVIELTKE